MDEKIEKLTKAELISRYRDLQGEYEELQQRYNDLDDCYSEAENSRGNVTIKV